MECGRMSDPSSWICGQMCECNRVIHANVNTGAYKSVSLLSLTLQNRSFKDWPLPILQKMKMKAKYHSEKTLNLI